MKSGKKKPRKGRKQQNHIVLQQLHNGQYVITLPRTWVDILELKKGDVVTFKPTEKGVEVVPVKRRKR